MLSNTHQIRVRYCDVDRMGYMHHGNYAAYFEIARTELLRELGITYKKMEDDGLILPVHHLSIDFKAPARYDDVLTFVTTVEHNHGVRLTFHYKVTNQEAQLICTAKTVLVTANAKTGKPIRVDQSFYDVLTP